MQWIKPFCLSFFKASRFKKGEIKTRFSLESLEPKVLLSAELLAGSIDAATLFNDPTSDTFSDPDKLSDWANNIADQLDSQTSQTYSTLNPPSEFALDGLASFFAEQHAQSDDVSQMLADAALAASAANDQPLELIIIDPRTPDYMTLIEGISTQSGSDYLVYMLDAEKDGIQQVTDLLAQHTELDAVHLISHGTSGGIQLGSEWLSTDNLDGYAKQIASWQNVFDENADILIYGCDLAGNVSGQQLVASLAQLTGADVAASTDVTGADSKGGDWDLEYKVGTIETSIAFSEQTQNLWQGTLATFTVDTLNDSVDINLGDGLAIDADGNTSLRAAIMEANAFGGDDTIILGSGIYTLDIAGEGEDEAITGDFDIRSNISIQGSSADTTRIDGGGIDRVFEVYNNGSLNLSNLTVQGGVTSDVGGAIYVQNPNAILALNQVNVSSNQGLDGAGIYNEGVMTLTNVEISGNTSTEGAAGLGGGLYNSNFSTLTNVTISGNSAGSGGGIYNTLTTLATNVTVSGNIATGTQGGGIYSDSFISLKNVTISNNTAQTLGGGIFNANSTTISNTIVANNSSISGAGNDVSGTFSSDGSNLVEDVTDIISFDSDITGIDPSLGILANNGGFTQTHAITTESAAYNSGTNSDAPSSDQRGIERDDITADIGAYEFKANNAPSATNLDQTQTYSEGNGSVDLGNIVISDGDTNEVVTAKLTLNDISTGALSVGTFGSAISTYNLSTGEWVVSGSITDVNNALANVAFIPATDNDIDTTITTQIEDAVGEGPNDGKIILKVIPQNDIPSATNMNQTINYSAGTASVNINNIVVTEVDTGDTITARLTLNSLLAGSLSTGNYGSATSTFGLLSGIWQISGTLAEVNAALADVEFNPILDFDSNTTITTRIFDSSGSGPANGTINLNVTTINDPATATNLTQTLTYNEGDSQVAFDDIVVTDMDNTDVITATLTLTNPTVGILTTGTFGSAMSSYDSGTGVWRVTGSVDDVNAALAAASFEPESDSDQDVTITTHIEDAAGTGPSDGSITLNVTAQNDAPTANNLTQSQAYNEGAASVALDNIVITDVDTGDNVTATLTLADNEAGTLSSGTFGASTSTYTAGTGVWTITGSVTDVNAALAAVAFIPATNHDTNTTISTHIEDTAGTSPVDGVISLNVTAQNDAPTANNLTQAQAYNEGAASVALDDIVITDVDTGDNFTATLTLADNDAGTLSSGTFGAGTSTYTVGTGVWTITGSVTDVNAALAAVAFIPATNHDTNTTISTHIEDTAGAGPVDGVISLNVTAQNDAPTANNLTQSQAYNEGAASVALDDIVITDVDTGDNVTATLTLADNDAGTLSGGTFGASTSTYTVGTGVWTITGSVTDVNAALAAVAFIPATNHDTNTTISTHIEDAAGAGPVDGLITLNVAAVNDDPNLSNALLDQAATEDSVFSFTLPNDTFDDADTGAVISYSAQLAGGAPLPTWLSFDESTRTFSGTPANGDIGTISVEVSAADGQGGTPATDTFDIVISNTNDDPTLDQPIPNQVAIEDGAFNFTFAANTFGDVDAANTLTYTAQLIGGAPLPAWLSFDTDTRTFSGTPANGDVGTISIELTADDGQGGTKATDSFNIVIANTNDMPTGAVVINGTPTEDQTLTADTSAVADDDGLAAFDYQWLRDGVAISGASASSYTLDDADVGKSISVQISYTDARGQAESLTSNGTAAITNVNDAPVGDVTISGPVTLGSTLTASNNLSDDDGLGGISYQWQRNGIDISGAVGTTYTLGVMDIANVINVVANYTDVNDTTESVSSAVTSAVTATNNAPTGSVTINGSAQENQVLTADTSGLLDADGLGAFSYQWQSDGTNISGAITSTYTLDDNEVGKTITVVVSYSDGLGTDESVVSDPTAKVTNVNDAPIATNLNQSKTYIEGVSSVAIDDIVITELDVGQNVSATLTLSNVSSGSLTTGTFGASSSTYNSITGIWAVSGSVANVNAALAAVSFIPQSNNDLDVTISTHIEDADGVGPAAGLIDLVVIPNNDDPTLDQALADQNAIEDSVFSFTFPANSFSDVDSGDSLTYSALLSNGAVLPAWLNFDASSRTFSGTPSNSDVGTLMVEVFADDGQGGILASDVFNISIANNNDAPTLDQAIANQAAVEDSSFSFTFNEATFDDVDVGDNLNYTATQADGSVLPVWLSFDANSRSFSGTPANDDVGTVTIEVTADDGNGGTVADSFDIVVTNSNDDPILDQFISDRIATEDSAFSFTIPENTFSDVDVGDNLRYSAQLVGGGTLPAWLIFDSGTRTFSGTPLNSDVGTISIEVFADDSQGGTPASDSFELTIANINDAPVGTVLINGVLSKDEVLSVDTSSLADEDGLGVLAFQWQQNGEAIVGATTETYVVQTNDLGNVLSVKVSYTDGGGSSEEVSSVSVAIPEQLIEPDVELEELLINESVKQETPDIINQPINPITNDNPQDEPEQEDSEEPVDNEDEAIEDDVSEASDEISDSMFESDSEEDELDDSLVYYPDTSSSNQAGSDKPSVDLSDILDASKENLESESEVSLREPDINYLASNDPLVLIQTNSFIKGLDHMREDLQKDITLGENVVASSLAVSAGVSAGYVAWLARSGVLLSSVLSSLPMWRFVDPLPILGSSGVLAAKDDETLESIIESGQAKDQAVNSVDDADGNNIEK